MRTNFSKYLTIPLIASFLFITIILWRLYVVYKPTNTYEFDYGYFITDHISDLASLPTIFTLTLIFSIAYQLVQPTFKNISYAILVVLAVIIINQINALILVYTYENYRPSNIYLMVYIYSYLYYFLFILMLTGISYLYAKFRNLSIIPLDKKLICILYACLFISYAIATIMQKIFIAYLGHILNIFTISLSIISLIIYFSYCYFFADTLLHSAKELTNHPYKIIFSYLLALLLFIIIAVLIVVAFMLLNYWFSPPDDLTRLLLIIGLVFSYIFGLALFFILLNISRSLIYRRIHIAFQLIIVPVAIAISTVNMHDQINIALLMSPIIAIYGFILFFVCLSLYILYVSSKVAICFCFKDKNNISNEVHP